MNFIRIIEKKRDGFELSENEVEEFVLGYTDGNIPDYQASAFLMAAYLKGLSNREAVYLTRAMVKNTKAVDLTSISDFVVDKHSTGGVGDSTTLLVGPLLGAVGIPIAKMSGRSLGHTGGTLDKLESIPGFNVFPEREKFMELVRRNGFALAGQTKDLVPADKKIYALRDVTATVENISLIASSIMSKKLTSGAKGLILDVKCGSGAFMKKKDESLILGQLMKTIGEENGLKTKAVLSDMNQPLGQCIGNGIEVMEVIQILKRERSGTDLEKLSLVLAEELGGLAGLKNSREKLLSALESGKALEVFQAFLKGQGADPEIINDPAQLIDTSGQEDVTAAQSGYFRVTDCAGMGLACQLLGAGRIRKEDEINHRVGIELYFRNGESVKKGDVLFRIYYDEKKALESSVNQLSRTFNIEEEKTQPEELVWKIL